MNRTKLYLYCLLLAVASISGCVERDLEHRSPNEGYLEITLDWKDYTLPKGARYLFYDESGNLVKEVEGTTEGFKGVLPKGKYHVLIYNNDGQQVGYRGLEHHETAEVFAKDVPTGKSSETTSDILEPQIVFAASCCMGVGEIVIENGKTVRRTVSPVPLTKEIKFFFSVKNATEIESLSGKLKGIAPSVFMTTGKSNFSYTCTTPFAGVLGENNTCQVKMSVFDLQASQETQPDTNTMDITLTADDKEYKFTVDLTDALDEIIGNNGGEIPVEVPIEVEIVLKEVGEGLTATVKPWDNSGTGSGDPRPKKESMRRI